MLQASQSKYKAKKAVINGIKFDSLREAGRYQELMQLSKAGKITSLALQVPFVLAPGVRLFGETRKRPSIKFIADFVYFDFEIGGQVIEDCKGMDLPMGRLKRHLMKTILGLDVVLT